MSQYIREAVNMPQWKIDLVRKHFKQDRAAEEDKVVDGNDIDAEFESIFSSSFIENYNPDEAFSKELDPVPNSPQSLKELASLASSFNDSGYEGQHSGVKQRGSIKPQEALVEEEESGILESGDEEEDNTLFASLLELLKLYMVVMGLLYMLYMTDSYSTDEQVGGKKAAIKFYYDRVQ